MFLKLRSMCECAEVRRQSKLKLFCVKEKKIARVRVGEMDVRGILPKESGLGHRASHIMS